MTVSPRKDRDNRVFVSPADRLITSLDGTYYKLSEVAEILQVSQSTLRRLMRNNKVKAPSEQATQGGMTVYLYTPDDVEEVRDYLRVHPEKRESNGPSGTDGEE